MNLLSEKKDFAFLRVPLCPLWFRLYCLAVLLLCNAASTAQTSTVPASRLAHLRHGINTSHWFSQHAGRYTKEHLETTVTAEDVALIKSMGFDHIRFSVDPEPLFSVNRANELPAEYLGYLDAAVKMILDHGLAVVIDVHPESDFKARLNKEDVFVQQFADFWRALAQRYSTWDTERVFFEIMNEPEFSDRYRWYGVEAKVAAAIREGAPRNTIIVAGARWSDDDDLVFLEPLRDTNVIYNFHFYDPHIFTHQGATWGAYYWHWTKGLKYPSDPESAARIAAALPDPVDRFQVMRYGQERWGPVRMEAEVNQVAEWAHKYGVPVVCNEFGVFRFVADPNDRAAWLHDVRSALEKYNMGWAMWDYDGGFGVLNRDANGKKVPDDVTLHALGLK